MKRYVAFAMLIGLGVIGGGWYWLHRDPLRDLPSPPSPTSPAVRLENYRRAVARFRQRWQGRVPTSAQGQERLGQDYAVLGHLLAARFFLKRAAQRSPQRMESWLFWGRTVLLLGLKAEAEKAAQEAIRLAPHDPAGYFLLADVRSAQARRGELKDVLSRAFRAVTPSQRVWVALEQARRGDADEAIRSFQAILRDEPDNQMALLGLSSVYMGVGRYEEAQGILERLPPSARRHALLGQLWERRGEAGKEKAMKYFEQALLLDPDDVLAWEHLAHLSLQARQWRQAAVAYLSLLLRRPDHIQARYGLAQVYQQVGRSHQYREQLRWYRALRTQAQRRQSLRAAIQRETATVQDYLRLSDLYYRKGDGVQVLITLSQAMLRFPQNPSLREARRRFFREVHWPEAAEQEEQWLADF